VNYNPSDKTVLQQVTVNIVSPIRRDTHLVPLEIRERETVRPRKSHRL